jgi:hypothetical protein
VGEGRQSRKNCRLADTRRFVNFDIAARAMWPSELLQGGLESFSRYLELIGDAAGFTLQPERGDCWLVLSPPEAAPPAP